MFIWCACARVCVSGRTEWIEATAEAWVALLSLTAGEILYRKQSHSVKSTWGCPSLLQRTCLVHTHSHLYACTHHLMTHPLLLNAAVHLFLIQIHSSILCITFCRWCKPSNTVKEVAVVLLMHSAIQQYTNKLLRLLTLRLFKLFSFFELHHDLCLLVNISPFFLYDPLYVDVTAALAVSVFSLNTSTPVRNVWAMPDPHKVTRHIKHTHKWAHLVYQSYIGGVWVDVGSLSRLIIREAMSNVHLLQGVWHISKWSISVGFHSSLWNPKAQIWYQ